MVKLPVPPQERRWLERLCGAADVCGAVVPHVYASGERLGGYDLAWVVMEQLRHGPLDHTWNGSEIDLLIEAAGRFYAASEQFAADAPPRDEKWADVLKRSRDMVHQQMLPEGQKWNASIRQLQKKLAKVMKVWHARDTQHWCHGDLHLGNAMTLAAPPHGPAVLFDLALVHTGHWVEDAIYFEHLFWSHPQRLGGRDVVKLIAEQRRHHGLKLQPNWPQLAAIRRALVAAAAPLEWKHRPNPAHMHACLHVLDQSLAHL